MRQSGGWCSSFLAAVLAIKRKNVAEIPADNALYSVDRPTSHERSLFVRPSYHGEQCDGITPVCDGARPDLFLLLLLY